MINAARKKSRIGKLLLSAVALAVGVIAAFGLSTVLPAHADTPIYEPTILADTPSHYYRLAETSGTVAVDSSGNGRDATYAQGITLARDSALVTDSNHSVRIVDSATHELEGTSTANSALPAGNSMRSVEAWFRTDRAERQSLVSWGVPDSHQAFSLDVQQDRITLITHNDNPYVDTPRPLNDNAWHQVVVTYDGGTTLAFYLDGQFLGSKTLTDVLNTSASNLLIGRSPYSAYVGDIDEVAIYPSALSSTSVAAHFEASGNTRPTVPTNVSAITAGSNAASISWNAASATVPTGGTAITGYVVTANQSGVLRQSVVTPGNVTTATITGLAGGSVYSFEVHAFNNFGDGPTGTSNQVTPSGSASTYAAGVFADGANHYYRFNETAGGIAADSADHRLGIFRDNVPIWSQISSQADGDASVRFNDSYVDPIGLSAVAVPAGSNPRSAEAWFRTDRAERQSLVSWGIPDSHQAFSLDVQQDRITLITHGDDPHVDTPRPLDDNAWHHVVITYDGSTTLTFYLDGQQLGSKTLTGVLNTSASNLLIGRSPYSHFVGDIDEVATYPSALSSTAVTAHFATSQNSRPTAPSNVVATVSDPNAVSISWNVASATVPIGGTAISGYVVTANQSGVLRQSVVTPGNVTTATITGLAGGSVYSFEVHAFNNFGDGPTGTSNQVTPSGALNTYATRVFVDGATHYYRLNEIAGRVAVDSADHRLGTYRDNAPTLSQASSQTDGDHSAHFNNSYVDPVGTSAIDVPTGSSPRTVETWFRTDRPERQALLSWGIPDSHQSFSLHVQQDRITMITNGDDPFVITPRPLNDNAWHHVMLTYDGGTTLIFYLDGQEIGTRTLSGVLNTPATDLLIGRSPYSTFIGDMDEVSIYPLVLSSRVVSIHSRVGRQYFDPGGRSDGARS